VRNKLIFPINHSVELIQNELLKKHHSALKRFSTKIQRLVKTDIGLLDELTALPHILMQSAIEEALLWALSSEKEYFKSNSVVDLKESQDR
jgi:hypothetical protein